MNPETQHQLQHQIEEIEADIQAVKRLLAAQQLVYDESNEVTAEEIVTEATDRRTLIKHTRQCIKNFEAAYGEAAPIDHVLSALSEKGYETSDVLDVIDQLRRQGGIYEPESDHMRVV